MELHLIGSRRQLLHRDRVLHQRSDDRSQRGRRVATNRRQRRAGETVLARREISRPGDARPRRSEYRQRVVEGRVGVFAYLHEFSAHG